MGGVLSLIQEKSDLTCLPCERVNLDYGQFAEYRDSYEHPAEQPFERPKFKAVKRKVEEIPATIPSLLRFFLDGSRRTYKIADVIIDRRRYLPIVAGQVGVAVMRRNEQRGVEPIREYCRLENVIAFPDAISKADLTELQREINERFPAKFQLLQYKDRKQAGKDPVDLAVARIMSEMHDMEIEAVQRMASDQVLSDNYSMLVIDGPLRFKKRFDLVQFRNVIGLSKTFRPTFTLGKGRRSVDVGSITSGLAYGERTSAFKTTVEDKIIGMWYLRIHPQDQMTNPLQGIVKIERYAVDSVDREEGFEADRVDNICRHILRERNVVASQRDSRWASHIYPICMAESYLKASFMGDSRFKALF